MIPKVINLPFRFRLTIWSWKGQQRIGTKALTGIGFILEKL